MYRCLKCNGLFAHDELVEVDHGGYEEFWGAKVWRSEFTDCSPCCFTDDIEEGPDDEEPE